MVIDHCHHPTQTAAVLEDMLTYNHLGLGGQIHPVNLLMVKHSLLHQS
jgi:hypothetical protein